MAKTKRRKKYEEKVKERENLLGLFAGPFDEKNPGHAPYIEKDVRGRPTVMTIQVMLKLEQAFKVGCPDREACIFAGISERTLYKYGETHPEFMQEKEEWKDNPVIAARAVIVESIVNRHSVTDSWEYLKRKRKEEFAETKNLNIREALTMEEIEAASKGEVEFDDAEELEEEE